MRSGDTDYLRFIIRYFTILNNGLPVSAPGLLICALAPLIVAVTKVYTTTFHAKRLTININCRRTRSPKYRGFKSF